MSFARIKNKLLNNMENCCLVPPELRVWAYAAQDKNKPGLEKIAEKERLKQEGYIEIEDEAKAPASAANPPETQTMSPRLR